MDKSALHGWYGLYIYTHYMINPKKPPVWKGTSSSKDPHFRVPCSGSMLIYSGLYLRSRPGPGWWKKSTSVFRYQVFSPKYRGFVFFLFGGIIFLRGGGDDFCIFLLLKIMIYCTEKKTNLYKVINSIVSHSYIYGLIPSKMYDGTKSQRTPGWPAAGGPRLARAAFGTRETLKRNVLRGHGVVVWWSLGIFGGNEWKRSDEILEYHRTPEIIYS